MYGNDRPPFGNKLWRPWYIIVMGWPRWGKNARVKWAQQMKEALQETIHEIDVYLASRDAR